MVICDICNDSYENEAMVDIDSLTASGVHFVLCVCPMCHEGIIEQRNNEKIVQVTKEMASDAGDKNLEGQWIKW